jgi:hypothetical protein
MRLSLRPPNEDAYRVTQPEVAARLGLSRTDGDNREG